MPFTVDEILIAALVFAVVVFGMRPLIAVLRRYDVLDHPNDRSNHTHPTPIGGGILVLAALIPAWWLLADRPMVHVLLPALALAAVSWLDDVRGVSPVVRFPAHIAAVAVALWFEPTFIYPLTQYVPEPVAYLVIAFVWIWFVNLFNFMDGIDGISGIEAASIGIGVAAVVAMHGFAHDFAAMGLTAAAAAVGFLVWNWHPAKVFLGDVGAVPLGFLLAWLLLSQAAAGPWIVAIILPAYYLADSTLTLLRRLARGEKVWRAHREHFYQVAAHHGLSHARVSAYVLLCNLALIAISLVYDRFHVLITWVMAAVPVIILLAVLRYARGRPAD